jgi:hypothetical protein
MFHSRMTGEYQYCIWWRCDGGPGRSVSFLTLVRHRSLQLHRPSIGRSAPFLPLFRRHGEPN